MYYKDYVFDEILGCTGHLTSPEKKWAPVAVKIFYKYVTYPALQPAFCCTLHAPLDDTVCAQRLALLAKFCLAQFMHFH